MRWGRLLAALKEYAAAHGHPSPPSRYRDSKGLWLGQWVVDQRAAYRAGELSPDRVAALDALGFRWETAGPDERFERGVAALLAWREAHGDADPSTRALIEGFALGKWISNQRTARSGGRLSPERVARLDEVGFRWDTRPAETSWAESLVRLRAYRCVHGHGRVPVAFRSEDGFALGSWVTRQRAAWRRGRLTVEQVAALEGAGFVWDVSGRRAGESSGSGAGQRLAG